MSHYHKASLIVARDRGHVKQLLRLYPTHEIISASDFFDRVRQIAFIGEKKWRRDDKALIPALVKHLANSQHYNLQHLEQFSSLYSACFHGTKTPHEIYETIKKQEPDFEPIFWLLKQVDEEINGSGAIIGVKALYQAWQAIGKNSHMCFGFCVDRPVEMYYLVDLTLLEIEVIKAMSRSGIPFVLHFPFDKEKRGINTVVDFIARQFENAPDLSNVEIIFDEIVQPGSIGPLAQLALADQVMLDFNEHDVSLHNAADVGHEAEMIAKKIAHLKTMSPQDKIVLSVRSLDARSLVYKQALKRYGIPYRERKGQVILESKAGLLFCALTNAKITSMGKKELVMLMNHASFCYYVSDGIQRSQYLSLMDRLGIDDSIMVNINSKARFKNSLERMHDLSDESNQEAINDLGQWLENCSLCVERILEHGTLRDHAQTILALFEEAFVEQDESKEIVCKVLRQLAGALGHSNDDPKIHLKDFEKIVSSILLKTTMNDQDNGNVNSVEILPMPELLGKQFDHVFIADMCFGKLPKNSSPDSLMNDSARVRLNSFFKIPVLRVYFEDPYEPSPTPPRQALEPLWFVSAIASAKRSIHFSYGERDEGGKEQAASDFFIWLDEHLKIHSNKSIDSLDFTSLLEKKFSAGMASSDSPMLSDFREAHEARMRSFADKISSDFAFQFNAHDMKLAFQGRLDDEPQQSLTPSFVESFSGCQFKGLMEKIVGVHEESQDADDIDPRIVGQIAHRSLELFFRKGKKNIERNSLIIIMKSIVHDVGKQFYQNHFIKNRMVFLCHEEWLVLVLVDLVQLMEKEEYYQHGAMTSSERAFGLHKNLDQGIIFVINGRKYIIGGRIDRIDEHADSLIVTDYKLSSTQLLKSDLNPKKIMHKSFQMPMYVRIVAKNLGKERKISFVYASIRDGKILKISSENYHDLFERIFDDDRPDGLAQKIDSIFAPIRQGIALPTTGDHCKGCNLSFVCRKNWGE